MKTIVLVICTVMVFSFAVSGCKSKAEQTSKSKATVDNQAESDDQAEGYQPTKRRIISEFQQVWNEVHGANVNNSNYWRLVGTEVGSIRADEKAKSATVNIKFTYKPGSKQERTKSADFLFHEIAGSWTIDHDTAKYPITP